MLDLDIVFVTYQSEKWIENCISSIAGSDYDLKRVHLYFVDNASTDGTVEKLEALQREQGIAFGSFVIRKSDTNGGFGKGNNLGAGLGSSPYLVFLNIDTEVFSDTLSQLAKQMVEDTGTAFGLWELRQMPYEHPKNYDILTGEVSWASGAAFAIRRDLYEQIGGFDENIFMYGEDVDLSWRVRMEGFKLRYVPKAAVHHYSYPQAGVVKPGQFVYSAVYNQLLRNKFGGWKERAEGRIWLALKLIKGAPFKGSRRALIDAYIKTWPKLEAAKRWHKEHIEKLRGQRFTFYGFNYEIERVGAFVSCGRPSSDKKVSVIVRTCGRPAVLRETLLSLRAQTYPNIEIVIVEDGPNVSEAMIREEFADLNIIYQATGEKRGRCVNGNIAMQLATGEYLNFLDDDDLFFADHVETLVYALEQKPEYRIAYSMGFETPIEVQSREPYRYDIKDIRTTCSAAFDLQELLYHNIAPIQAVMFEKSIFIECGGLDETLDVLEDMDMWIRYGIHTPFLFVPKTTSVYRVPANRKSNLRREHELDAALDEVRGRYAYMVKHETKMSIKGRILRDRTNSGVKGGVYRCIRGVYRTARRIKERVKKCSGRTI